MASTKELSGHHGASHTMEQAKVRRRRRYAVQLKSRCWPSVPSRELAVAQLLPEQLPLRCLAASLAPRSSPSHSEVLQSTMRWPFA
jgi:hypothetical protein